jgi:hypothetical protein
VRELALAASGEALGAAPSVTIEATPLSSYDQLLLEEEVA